jgi:hypothetical protein
VAGALTPKPIIWYVMQITKIHFIANPAQAEPERQDCAPMLRDQLCR